MTSEEAIKGNKKEALHYRANIQSNGAVTPTITVHEFANDFKVNVTLEKQVDPGVFKLVFDKPIFADYGIDTCTIFLQFHNYAGDQRGVVHSVGRIGDTTLQFFVAYKDVWSGAGDEAINDVFFSIWIIT